MKKLRNGQPPVRKIAVGSAAAVTALGLTVMVTSPSAAAIEQDPNEEAEALGQLVQSELLDDQLVDAAGAYSSFPSNPEEAKTPLNAEALSALDLDLGNGVSLPVISEPGGEGLLKLGEAGALNAYGNAPSADSAKASAGAVGKDGALNVDDINNGDYGNAEVDLTQVLGQAGLDGVTDNIVDELSLSLGAVASTAEANGSENPSSEYVVADGVMTVSSPAVGGLSDELNKVVDGAGGTLEDVIAEEGLADELAKAGIDINTGLANLKLGGEGTTVSVETQDALNSVVENLVNEKLADKAGIVSIDLKNGDIKIDLAKVVNGENGEDLNGLDPNTQVLTSETIGKITDAVAEALGTLSGKLNETLKDGLNDAHAKISLPAEGSVAGIPADGKIDIDATLGQLAGTGEGDPKVTTDLNVAGIDLGDLINSITGPLLEGLLGVTEPIIGGILNSTADQVTGGVTDAVDPILSGLDPVFEGLNKVVDLTINEQPTKRDPAEDSNVKGTEDAGFTVNAVSLELLPNVAAPNQAQAADAVADINLASSSVRATAADEAPGDDANADDTASADADDSASADADDSAAATADADDSATADADDSAAATADADDAAAANADVNASADADDSASATNDANASATADADDSAATTAEANASANADDSAAATDDANAAADNNDEANASASSADDANASNDASASAAADGGDLPRTGANGTLALGGLAALLVAGGGIAIYLTRRNRSGL
ncbi:choice-of-anchor G family protein [Brevibacterium sp. BDJS002]|uniref:choice-of-anchor G family protein n=1 Tax=Brevibacterium sp. BDJS002 TaxID=3020906 RepID=UPI0023072107|nr:choice-of-anchor G family protein [Brevibacterium sp. BDJS002]WCE39343.1 choice-of-anchor G family protein [Brevibacterium sp. BDJS002]